MTIRTRHRRTATTAAVAVATALTALTALTTAGTAQAAPERSTAPGFLSARELPPHPFSPWYEGEVARGLPEFPVFCLEEALPAKGAWHRQFHTEYDTGAVQVAVRTAGVGAARRLAAEAEASVRDCAADFRERYPGASARWKDYGRVDVEEGAHVYGVHTAPPESEYGIHLFGVGRDGRTVTVVAWGQMGTFEHAPVKDFRETTRTAVDKLYR
ncbi:hypothetical protein [Streptomyces radiopugnans]|uniref:PknH-like extracellular domain-containing protein n=1 Tax=Streptomyces radiopugnans TaxID=403935 RepID=A0A1H9JLG9_9ACTN|nr:hypothetical protein [Streptomyces radiopugnans]SEQ87578.1 hypothetical protein SAMN05216481_11862 [Streptomyces radiopugnans]